MFYNDEDDSFSAVYECRSAAFLTDRERVDIENGGKILLPQAALEQLIEETGIMLFRLENLKEDRSTHCGVLEFLPSAEPLCYLPHWMMRHLLLDEGDEIQIKSVHNLPAATFVRFQPQSKSFLDLTNPKAVLERLLRNFSCLTKGDLISIHYLNRTYELFVCELKPSNVVSIIECDMEVDFTLPMDTTEPSSLPTIIRGQGIYFEDRIKPNHLGSSQKRGLPNYNYKFGLLQFPREPLRAVKNEIASNTTTQLFTGDGNSLRMPRGNERRQ